MISITSSQITSDKSGSMGNIASAGGVETSNLCILDIVKHAVKTIIGVLDENDRLSVVSYSDQVPLSITSYTRFHYYHGYDVIKYFSNLR